jgi:hypothetical protein
VTVKKDKKKKKRLNIKEAIKNPGALRKSLGIKNGQTIPIKTLNKLANAGGKLGQRARFAKTLRGLGRGR